tara:strand:+ start:671 stop:1381 length:711 start_codon:yes stop_codon:yes gene_type:complete
MKLLKNWDKNTWLSSKKYIKAYCQFLKSKTNINRNTKLLDIGCGRANIISFLDKQIKFFRKPIGVDIVKNKELKKNIVFKKIDAVKFLKFNKSKYDLIIIKQTIHFFSNKRLKTLLNLINNRLNPKGKLIIFSLKTINNQIPCFGKMEARLIKGLKRDEKILKIVCKHLKVTKISYFNFKVNIAKKDYLRMIKARYISCLLNFSKKEILKGVSELNQSYKERVKFTDTLKCITYQK